MNTQSVIALFGGTFNPPHQGHLTPLLSLIDELTLECVRALPAKQPPHKAGATLVSETHRLEMLKRLYQPYPSLRVDDTELHLPTPSFSVQTLRYFRQLYPFASVLFIMGEDSLKSLPQWHEWREISSLAHVVVLRRQDTSVAYDPNSELGRWLEQVKTTQKSQLFAQTAGKVFFAETPLLDVSSTQIRHELACAATSIDCVERIKQWLPKRVLDYIQQHNLYQQ
ncbi:nicotinate-nucleotide adenylyltransferase [Alteromonas oceanisediminis]|uniref:nicotinate-nucleotide adenylyltransferase n=1 Tax=Alteromonas oceanisediminis TaxID=2836180 RepID=UPI001BDACF94|nr:nicotinate-nucleotide adenylyltransferase [Alteromonas oceanisediminis]MBT0586529.1 nicotinate-nucleotide adenylyltransferase [Alteromonas oceanisediminis]